MLPLLSYWLDIIKGRNAMHDPADTPPADTPPVEAAPVEAAPVEAAAAYDLENINRLRAKAGKVALTAYAADDIAANCGEGVDIEQTLVQVVLAPSDL